MTNSDEQNRPFIAVEVADRHGIYVVRVGNWLLIKDLNTGEGGWQWIGKEKEINKPLALLSLNLDGQGSTDLSASGILDKHTLREAGKDV